ncbi:OsmC family peroxiredoxin [candidate division KSB1 bacterium]|nr:MAG: OsmC family peroxiredoxin [candidate division KSB1 bacterium]
MKVQIRHVDGHTFVAKSDSNHWIPLDTGTASGGSGAANDPFQLFIISCGGCAFIDVADILKKSRKTISRMELAVEASRAEAMPKILRELLFQFSVDGEDITVETVKRAIELSLTKYCSVSLSVDRSVKFKAQITLNGETTNSWEIQRDPTLFSATGT